MKAQFFLVGALLLCLLFFIGLPYGVDIIKTSEDLEYFSLNIKKEMPVVYNLGLNESNAMDRLQNFTDFLTSNLKENYVNYTSFLVLIQNQSGNLRGLNITVLNYLGYNVTANFTIALTKKQLFIVNGTVNSTLFRASGSRINLTIEVDGESETIDIMRDAANLYGIVKLSRGTDLIKESFSA